VTTQPELPEAAAPAARRALRLAPAPGEYGLDFDGFVRTYEARLRRLVMRRIGDLCEAEEITQETLLRAYQHRATFASEDELMAWSTVVAQRLVIDRVRVRGRSVAVADVPETARLGRDTAEIVVARHEARAALESLEAIPTRQAAILWAREVEGLHYEEIAERFGITEPAVRSLLHRGRRALRKEFKDRTGSLPLNGLVPFAPWLIALKAAGKLRGAAKTFAKSSGGAAAALSITALVASTLVGIGGGQAGSAPNVRIYTAHGGATLVQSLGAPAGTVERPALHGARYGGGYGGGGSLGGGPADGPGAEASACLKAHRAALCGTAKEAAPWTGATVQIGPNLPENPTGLGNIKVSSDRIDCETTHLPSSGLVSCTQNGPPQRTPVRPIPSRAPEGVLR
jgi:RNA polymerase sigma factor (sigma-70 family)